MGFKRQGEEVAESYLAVATRSAGYFVIMDPSFRWDDNKCVASADLNLSDGKT